MQLLEIDKPGLDLVERWLSASENHKWPDFGLGCQVVPRPMLGTMAMHGQNCLRLIAPQHIGQPVGLAALSDISAFRTATLWYVLGAKEHAGKGLIAQAVSLLLDIGFRELNLNSVQAWTVDTNRASIGLLNKMRFPVRWTACCSIS